MSVSDQQHMNMDQASAEKSSNKNATPSINEVEAEKNGPASQELIAAASPTTPSTTADQDRIGSTSPKTPKKVGWFGTDARAWLRGNGSPAKGKPWVMI